MEETQMVRFFRSCIYDICKPHCRPQIVRLKGRTQTVNEFENFLAWGDAYEVWDGAFVKRIVRLNPKAPLRQSVKYFIDHAAPIFNRYLLDSGFCDVRDAMRSAGSFSTLFDNFTNYYVSKRRKFMEQTDALIDKAKAAGLTKRQSKVPASHGGVANLLKVLTRTMTEQGADIRSIAKVQYAICTQAGIYVPDEFITDVLTAVQIENGKLSE